MQASLIQETSLAGRQILRIFSSLHKRVGAGARPTRWTCADRETGRMHEMNQKNPGIPPDQGSRQLRRVLRRREAVALGVGGTIGGGIFVLVGAAAGRAGPGALLSF